MEEAWDRYLQEEMEVEMGAALAALAFFACRSMAEKMAAECSGADASVGQLAEMFRRVFPDAVMEYAGMGRVIHETVREAGEGIQDSKPASAPVGPKRSLPVVHRYASLGNPNRSSSSPNRGSPQKGRNSG